MCLMALSSVINFPICSFYPDTKARCVPNLFNAKIFPRQASAGFVSPPMNLFWSLIGANKKDINPMFATNHVVTLFVVQQEHVDSSLEILKDTNYWGNFPSRPNTFPSSDKQNQKNSPVVWAHWITFQIVKIS